MEKKPGLHSLPFLQLNCHTLTDVERSELNQVSVALQTPCYIMQLGDNSIYSGAAQREGSKGC